MKINMKHVFTFWLGQRRRSFDDYADAVYAHKLMIELMQRRPMKAHPDDLEYLDALQRLGIIIEAEGSTIKQRIWRLNDGAQRYYKYVSSLHSALQN